MFHSDQLDALAAIGRAWPHHYMEKFFVGIDAWIGDARSRCERLGLAGVPSLRVFDVGCGVPYFMAAAKDLGHEVAGLDVPDQALEGAAAVMGLSYIRHVIYEAAEFPAIGGPFDLVTMFGVNLRHQDERWWDWGDWRDLVAILLESIVPGGRLVMQPNRGPHCSELLMDESRWQWAGLPARVRIDGIWLIFERR